MFKPACVAFCLAAILVAPARAADPVTIGAIEILSGPSSRYGLSIKAGLELARDEIDEAGGVLGGRKLELIIEDSAGAKDQAVNAARKLIGRDQVPLIIGPTLSGEMFAVGPVAVERKVPIIGTSTTAKGITDIGPYVFRTSLPEADVVPVTLKAAQTKFGIKRVAILYGNDDAFTKSGYESFKAALDKLGIEIVATESFASTDTDFSAQLTKIQSLKPDAVVLAALVEAASGILLQAHELGFPKTTLFIGGNGLNSPKLGELAGEAADGVIVGSPWFVAKKDSINQKFVASFKAKHGGTEPDQFAAQAYDTVFIAAEAINRAKAADPEKITAALAQTDHQGVMGHFAFTPGRDPASNDGVVVLTLKAGRFELLQ